MNDHLHIVTVDVALAREPGYRLTRRNFKHPNLKEWAHSYRSELLSAVLSLVRAWVVQGMPRGHASIGGFESWAGVMSGILNVSGVSGLLGGREELHNHSEMETQEWTAFLSTWYGHFGPRPVTAGELFELARERGLLLDLWGGRSAIAGKQRLGHALKARRDRIYGALRIRAAGQDATTRNATHRLEATSTGGVTSKHPKHPTYPESQSSPQSQAGCFDDPFAGAKHI